VAEVAGANGRAGLDGAACVVTGGASGIGLAAVRQLAAAGARVVVADVDEGAARAAADEVGASSLRCDVREPSDSERMVAAAEEAYGRLDFAFLNAGVTAGFTSWDDFDLDRYRLITGVNVDGVVFGVRAALPALRRAGGGSIVATASLAGLTGTPASPLYALTKHAVVGLVRSLADPLATEGITINAVCPGFTETPLLDEVVDAFHASGFPLLTPDEVATAAIDAAVSGQAGQCVVCQPGREPLAYGFRGIPGPRGNGQGQQPPTRHEVP
jgi:NAD(P)-dependent dehydrogenase (short-subunit alcohol dehydrogenase family)